MLTTVYFAVENYRRGDVQEVKDCVRLKMSDSAVHMKVNYGSKIRNLMGYAMKKMKVGNCEIY